MAEEGHVNSAYEMFPEKGQDISPAKVKVILPEEEMPADYCYSGKDTTYSSNKQYRATIGPSAKRFWNGIWLAGRCGPLSAHQLNTV